MKLRSSLIIFFILFLSLLARIILQFQHIALWWDSSVYLAMAKYLVSDGISGIWEPIRPPLLPLLLTLGEFFHHSFFLGIALQIALSLGCILLLFFITEHHLSRKEDFLAITLFSFSGVFLFLSSQVYTEILAMFLILSAYFLFLRKQFFFAGMGISLAILAKFPSGLFLFVLGFALLFSSSSLKLRFRHLSLFILGNLIFLVPFLLLNKLFYGSYLNVIFEAQEIIGSVLGCNVLYAKPWYFYFSSLFFSNPLLLLSVGGLFLRKKIKNYPLLLMSTLIPFLYFMSITCKDHRYSLFFLPFLCIFAAQGIMFVIEKYQFSYKKILVLVLLFSLISSFLFAFSLIIPTRNYFEDQAMNFFEQQNFSGPVLTTHPRVALVSNASVIPVYYARYDARLAKQFSTYVHSSISYTLYFDTCAGGVICPPDDLLCKEENEALITYIEQNTTILYDVTTERCRYLIAQT